MLDIIGVGDVNIDIMISVDHPPYHDEKVRGKEIGKFPGGIIGNFCSAAAGFGAATGALCKIVKDEYGKLSIDDLQKRGIDTSRMVIGEDSSTYYCIVQLDDTGEKALTIVETDAIVPKKEEIDIEYLKTAKRVHMNTLDVELVAYVAKSLDGSDVKLSLDIEPTCKDLRPELWDAILPRLDVALPNKAGLEHITGKASMEEGAKALLEKGVKTVVVTCGDDGVYITDGKTTVRQGIFKVDVKDTTGAGDCFNAVFLGCLVRGYSYAKAAKYASAAAAISIRSFGARSSLPSEKEIEDFIKSYDN